MFQHFGGQGWWPGETPIEIVVGAILTQNTNWENVRKAIVNLKDAGVLDFYSLLELPAEVLAEYVRPSGYYNIKTRRLKNLLAMIRDRYDGNLDGLLADQTAMARENLLSVQGIGPETADSILLYAGGHPVFVIDAYTHRIFSRHGLVAEESDYDSIQEEFEGRLPRDAALYNEFHALIVMAGKHFCKKTTPLCDRCPLRGLNGMAGDTP
ncbi:endonuclease III domain-containing protein [Desulfoprunum benzoelyticum]|nr:endonuclease III domain-containing protein [Desulfoprunum benzoelyticum]MBM9530812.1 endonuclease III domain-containing protein [Desulfoprunum benzoelyticum]